MVGRRVFDYVEMLADHPEAPILLIEGLRAEFRAAQARYGELNVALVFLDPTPEAIAQWNRSIVATVSELLHPVESDVENLASMSQI